ncbi:MAG: hypothetical protein JSW52_05485 [Candidatus Coatesbacteria bacterium]|nr:MAG: hypothetical protein JSW52_05485 [Candidatus Coatesbacteria bacterium]
MARYIKLIVFAAVLAAAIVAGIYNAIVGAAVGVVALIALVWTVMTWTKPGLKVVKGNIDIEIKDGTGKLARFTRTQTLVPVKEDLVDIRDRNTFTKGTIDDFELSVGEVGERMTIGKYYIIKTVFKPPLPKGKEVTRSISYNMFDAFVDDEVSFMFVGDYPTRDFTFGVRFPEDRKPASHKAYSKDEGGPKVDAALAEEGDSLVWRITNLKPGTQYYVEWVW